MPCYGAPVHVVECMMDGTVAYTCGDDCYVDAIEIAAGCIVATVIGVYDWYSFPLGRISFGATVGGVV